MQLSVGLCFRGIKKQDHHAEYFDFMDGCNLKCIVGIHFV